MDKRQETLSEVHSWIEGIDKEITMILQSLQWDRKHLLEGISLVSCKYDSHHKVPLDKKTAHEEECFLRSQGYSKNHKMLPDLSPDDASKSVKLSREDIIEIINKAAQADPSFKRGPGPPPRAPLTAERLQASYTADERRAIHDAVVSAAPDTNHVDDLALPGTSNEDKKRPKTKMEVLAELRDMRRRRTKYRGASGGASNKYSDVLRDVIKTQMELFTGVKEEPEESTSKPADNTREHVEHKHYHDKDNGRDDRRGKQRDEHKTKQYEERNKSGDKRHYDSYTEKYHSREDKEKKEIRYEDDYINYSDNEKHIKKERDKYDKEFYKQRNGHTSHKSGNKRDIDMYKREPRSSLRDASESRSERSYKKDNYYESSSSRNDRRYKEEYKDTRSTKRHAEEIDRDRHSYDDIKHSKHRDSKRRDEYSYDKKRNRHS